MMLYTYEKISDFEINKAVAGCLYRGPYIDMHQMGSNTSVEVYDQTGELGTFDYCNNPADAWPLIAENKINIDFQYGLWPTAEYDEYIYTDKNPLRAAMIVFLMMNGDNDDL